MQYLNQNNVHNATCCPCSWDTKAEVPTPGPLSISLSIYHEKKHDRSSSFPKSRLYKITANSGENLFFPRHSTRFSAQVFCMRNWVLRPIGTQPLGPSSHCMSCHWHLFKTAKLFASLIFRIEFLFIWYGTEHCHWNELQQSALTCCKIY